MCDKTINNTYTIRCPEAADRELTFRVVLDAKTLEEVGRDPGSPPSWTRMDTAQCGVCPLRKEDHPHCPAALALVEVVEKVGDLISYTEVHATVTTRERTFSADTTVQRALSSLIGLRTVSYTHLTLPTN